MKVPDIRGGKYGSDYGTRDFDSVRGHNDSGGASRFFYVAKASKRDRNEGLENQNSHPTVKPTELMKYLIKLVTPPNGTVLDPFTGSGSTGKAALLEGCSFIGIEMTEDYIPIIEGRLRHAEQKLDEGLF
jgi:site-specific DNA-methyltransferase (adenine-specific)